MPFQKGHKLGKGGRNDPPGGRPTKEQAEEKRLQAEKARDIIEKSAERLANRYVKRALAQKADKILMHAIERLVPAAKQQLELSGQVKVVRLKVPDLNG